MPNRINPSSVREVPTEFQGIYTHGVAVTQPKNLLFLSGQIGVSPDGRTPDRFEDQCLQAMQNVEALLSANGMTNADIVKITYYLVRQDDLPALTRLRHQNWSSDTPPAITTLVISALANPSLLVEIDVIAASE